MPSIRVREGEPAEGALRRFKRACEKAGLLPECRRRQTYEKPTTTRKRKRAAAVKRHLKKLHRENPYLSLRGGKKPDKRKQHLSHVVKKAKAEPTTDATDVASAA